MILLWSNVRSICSCSDIIYYSQLHHSALCISYSYFHFDFLPALSSTQILQYLANHPISGHTIGLLPLIFNYFFKNWEWRMLSSRARLRGGSARTPNYKGHDISGIIRNMVPVNSGFHWHKGHVWVSSINSFTFAAIKCNSCQNFKPMDFRKEVIKCRKGNGGSDSIFYNPREKFYHK